MSKLLIIGIGPGDASSLTERAHSALAEADLICGYNLYVDLVRPLFPEKALHAQNVAKGSVMQKAFRLFPHSRAVLRQIQIGQRLETGGSSRDGLHIVRRAIPAV